VDFPALSVTLLLEVFSQLTVEVFKLTENCAEFQRRKEHFASASGTFKGGKQHIWTV